MSKPTFLPVSLQQLQAITSEAYNAEIAPIAQKIWAKHLQLHNPLWGFLVTRPFYIQSNSGSAHAIAMVDKRLPNLGLVGYFACTDSETGAEVLKNAALWLKDKHGIKEVFGPINGTATSDYRLNYTDDYWFPGEPVNPLFYIDAFKKAGYYEFNHYASGLVKHPKLFTQLFIKPPKNHPHIYVRPFESSKQLRDLRVFHDLMVAIFPGQSAYCPTLSWKERLFNFQDKDPFFNPRYTYFLEDKGKPIGLISSFPYNQNLIIKTIGVLPEYRGMRLSNLLARKVHQVAAEDSLNTAIYAMVRLGNTIHQRKKPGVEEIRHYVTMRKSF